MELSLEKIVQKVENQDRIDAQEALWLFEKAPLDQLCSLALQVKEKRHQKNVWWVNNRQINYTNICVLHCSFCSFSKIKKDSKVAYDWSYEEILEKALFAVDRGARELHIVGGLHPDHDFSYYLQMLKMLANEFPKVDLKAFTAVEISYFAEKENRSVEEILSALKKAGLKALPGGGAEILGQKVRDQICGPKETGEEWLNVHRTAHKLGINTNATMLFGHIESYRDRVEHMGFLRDLQDETQGFFAFIPLVFHPENNALGRKVGEKTSPEDRLRTIAVARIFLDNFPHIKAYWVHLGLDVARQALHSGASDLDGTIIEEKITKAAGSVVPQGMTAEQMVELIESEGLVAVERDALYHQY